MRSIRLLPVALVALACAKEPAPAGAPAEGTPQQVTVARGETADVGEACAPAAR